MATRPKQKRSAAAAMADEEAPAAEAEPGEDAAPPEGVAVEEAGRGEASPPRGEAEEEKEVAAGGEESPGGEEGLAAEGGDESRPETGASAEWAVDGQESEAREWTEEEILGAALTEGEEEDEEEEDEEPPSRASLLEVLPTSASFEEGEPSEPSPLLVGVQLGRRISQSLRELEALSSLQQLEPGESPEGLEEEEEESAEAAEARRAAEERERAELLQQCRQLAAEQGRLRHCGAKLQGRLAEALNKAKGKERPPAELEQHISDKEQRYSRYLAMLQELRSQQREEMAWFQQQIDALQHASQEELAKVKGRWKSYQAAKKEVAVFTMGRRLGGKQAAVQQVDQIQAKEETKEKEMTEVRLENIKLKHSIAKLEASLKAQEELAEGLHLIDFEQLKIENQTYNEKTEERSEELLKLRRKITNTVQVLTQVKEKLQFVEAENLGRKAQLIELDSLVAKKRDSLTKTKQERDRLRRDNEKLLQKCGLLADKTLLRDLEENVNAEEILTDRLDALKFEHARFVLACDGVKKKIKGIKYFLPI